MSARGGLAVKGTGDGLMAVFDAAAEAVATGVAMQQATQRYARQSGVPLEFSLAQADPLGLGGCERVAHTRPIA